MRQKGKKKCSPFIVQAYDGHAVSGLQFRKELCSCAALRHAEQSSWRPRWWSLQARVPMAGSCPKSLRHLQRDPPTLCWLMLSLHMSEKTLPKLGRNHNKGAERILRAHAELGIVCVPTSWSRKKTKTGGIREDSQKGRNSAVG